MKTRVAGYSAFLLFSLISGYYLFTRYAYSSGNRYKYSVEFRNIGSQSIYVDDIEIFESPEIGTVGCGNIAPHGLAVELYCNGKPKQSVAIQWQNLETQKVTRVNAVIMPPPQFSYESDAIMLFFDPDHDKVHVAYHNREKGAGKDVILDSNGKVWQPPVCPRPATTYTVASIVLAPTNCPRVTIERLSGGLRGNLKDTGYFSLADWQTVERAYEELMRDRRDRKHDNEIAAALKNKLNVEMVAALSFMAVGPRCDIRLDLFKGRSTTPSASVVEKGVWFEDLPFAAHDLCDELAIRLSKAEK